MVMVHFNALFTTLAETMKSDGAIDRPDFRDHVRFEPSVEDREEMIEYILANTPSTLRFTTRHGSQGIVYGDERGRCVQAAIHEMDDRALYWVASSKGWRKTSGPEEGRAAGVPTESLRGLRPTEGVEEIRHILGEGTRVPVARAPRVEDGGDLGPVPQHETRPGGYVGDFGPVPGDSPDMISVMKAIVSAKEGDAMAKFDALRAAADAGELPATVHLAVGLVADRLNRGVMPDQVTDATIVASVWNALSSRALAPETEAGYVAIQTPFINVNEDDGDDWAVSFGENWLPLVSYQLAEGPHAPKETRAQLRGEEAEALHELRVPGPNEVEALRRARRFIPDGVEPTFWAAPAGLYVLTWTTTRVKNGVEVPGWVAIGFSGKSDKPIFHTAFATEKAMRDMIAGRLKSQQDKLEREAKAKTDADKAVAGLKVGDIFYSSWGYDQTNVDFYQVTGLTPKGVKIRKIGKKVEKSNGPADYVVPIKGSFDPRAKEMTKRVRSGYGDKAAITLTSYSSAWLWDGKPVYETGAMYGH